jgi:hypothetical protein
VYFNNKVRRSMGLLEMLGMKGGARRLTDRIVNIVAVDEAKRPPLKVVPNAIDLCQQYKIRVRWPIGLVREVDSQICRVCGGEAQYSEFIPVINDPKAYEKLFYVNPTTKEEIGVNIFMLGGRSSAMSFCSQECFASMVLWLLYKAPKEKGRR